MIYNFRKIINNVRFWKKLAKKKSHRKQYRCVISNIYLNAFFSIRNEKSIWLHISQNINTVKFSEVMSNTRKPVLEKLCSFIKKIWIHVFVLLACNSRNLSHLFCAYCKYFWCFCYLCTDVMRWLYENKDTLGKCLHIMDYIVIKWKSHSLVLYVSDHGCCLLEESTTMFNTFLHITNMHKSNTCLDQYKQNDSNSKKTSECKYLYFINNN